jgi:hypothetical protein
LGLKVVQPGVSENDAGVSKVGDKERLDSFLVALSNAQFDMPLNDSSSVFHPIHIVDFSWSWEEHCLDLESLGKSPIDEVFCSSAVDESFLFSRSM